jgi:hypothetical protein
MWNTGEVGPRVAYVIEGMGWSDLDSALCPDGARGGGDDDTLVAGFASSPGSRQPCVSVEERVVRTAHINAQNHDLAVGTEN